MFMGVVVEYPSTVYVDRVWEIFLLENIYISQKIKHIDVQHHFIRDYGEDGTVKIKFFLF